jgi:hypothetical protein
MPSKITLRLSSVNDLFGTNDSFLGISSISALTLKQFASDSRFGNLLASNSIDGNKIIDNTINGSKILDESITGNSVSPNKGKIGSKTITGYNIADKSIIGAKLADKTITALQIANNTITGEQIALNTITSAKILNGTIEGVKIAPNTIANDRLRLSAGLSVIGRSANSQGDPADIVGTANQILRVSSTNTLGFGSVNLSSSSAVNGVLPIANGGTGASNASDARTNLGALAISGGTMTGFLTLHSNPNSSLHAATRGYVDSIAQNNLTFITGRAISSNTDIYPPTGKTMSDLLAFIPSIETIRFSGDVDGNDTLTCSYDILTNRISVVVQNSEQKAVSTFNYISVWK